MNPAETKKKISFFNFPVELTLWTIYLILFPIYYFPSGQPQISDYFIVLVIGTIILRKRLSVHKDFQVINIIFICFLVYIGVVNFFLYAFTLGKPFKGLPWYIVTLFYVYNYLVFRLIISLYQRFKILFLNATIVGLALTAIVPILFSNFGINEGYIRGTLTFETPNQLGYFSLIVLSLFLILQKAVKIPSALIYLVTGACFYMAAVSLSFAVIFSVVILFLVFFLESGLNNVRRLSFLILIGLMGAIALYNTEFGQSTIERFRYRQNTSIVDQAGVSQIEYRGYDRILNHPEYLLLGAGEGAYNRFDTFIENHEIHSSFGTIIFCYGVPGFTLFLLLIYSCLKGLKIGIIAYTLPIFAYGVTHMGLRFTFFWIALALFPVLRHYSIEYWKQKAISTSSL